MKHRSYSAPAALFALAVLMQGTAWAQPADADGDGTADAVDECPGTAAGTLVDRKGCAAKLPPLPADEFPEAAAEAAVATTAAATPALAPEAAVPVAAAVAPAPVAEPIVAAPARAEPVIAQPEPAPEPVVAPAPAPVVEAVAPVAAYQAPAEPAATSAPIVAPAPEPLPVVHVPGPQPATPIPWTAPAVALPPGVSILPAATPSAVPPPSPSLAAASFDTGSAKLTGNTRKQLDGVLAALRAQPDLQLQLIGHTAAGESNGLALARAQAVRIFLVDLGIAATRLKASGKAGGGAAVEFQAQ